MAARSYISDQRYALAIGDTIESLDLSFPQTVTEALDAALRVL